MWTKSRKFMLQASVGLASAAAVGAVAGWPRSGAGTPIVREQQRARAAAPEHGDLIVARLRAERAEAIIGFSERYQIPADLATAVFDAALQEGIDPGLAFSLVNAESNFDAKARSRAGAIGYTQILPSTARLYEPSLAERQLFDRRTNLHLGFRYLRDLLERYETTPEAQTHLALLAYNRGPAKVQELLDAGRDPQNGYSRSVMKAYRRKS